jgi:hypothetical protein
VLDRRGQPLAVGAGLSSAYDDGKRMVSVELHSAALGEGDYVLELIAGPDPSDRQLVAFRIGR